MSKSPSRILLITGVAGSGKSTIGQTAAITLGWPYFEADDFHSVANKAKMASGTPLNDTDRAPWLAAIRAKIDEVRAADQCAVFTCSALKESYRHVLMHNAPEVVLVYLSGDFDTIAQRVGQRAGHYMKSDMVRSQFAALEPPQGALTLDVAQTPEALVAQVLAAVR
ncbi:MAG: gluconokinase [Candidatus Didemnitutus sp.]|nr:gluconokinase [Candidatus Didemnitutus sp.]